MIRYDTTIIPFSSYMLDVLHWLPSTEGFVPYNCFSLASWASLRLIFETSAALPRVLRVVALSALLSGAFLSSLLPAQQLSRIASSLWLASRSGMGYLNHCHCSLEFSQTLYDHLKTLLLVLKLGVLLSRLSTSRLEGAL